jgi:hypothetical protein
MRFTFGGPDMDRLKIQCILDSSIPFVDDQQERAEVRSDFRDTYIESFDKAYKSSRYASHSYPLRLATFAASCGDVERRTT